MRANSRRVRLLALASLYAVSCLVGGCSPPAPATPDEDSLCEVLPATPLAPVPESALGIEVQGAPVVTAIDARTWWITDGAYQAMFFATGAGVVLVDAPIGPIGEALPAAVASVSAEPITHLIYSQADEDHIGEAWRFADGLTVIAHADAAARLAQDDALGIPAPTTVFDDALDLVIGDRAVRLDFWPNPDETGNISIHLADSRVLMLVDVFWPGWVPFRNLTLGQDVPGLLAGHERVLGYEFDTLVSGHVTRLGRREDVLEQREWLGDLLAAVDEAAARVVQSAAADRHGATTSWGAYEARVVEVARCCAQATEPEWRERLGGADVFGFDHCRALARGRMPVSSEAEVDVVALGEGLWMLRDNTYQALAVETSTSIVVVDAPTGLAEGLQTALRRVTTKPVSHLVLTSASAERGGGGRSARLGFAGGASGRRCGAGATEPRSACPGRHLRRRLRPRGRGRSAAAASRGDGAGRGSDRGGTARSGRRLRERPGVERRRCAPALGSAR